MYNLYLFLKILNIVQYQDFNYCSVQSDIIYKYVKFADQFHKKVWNILI